MTNTTKSTQDMMSEVEFEMQLVQERMENSTNNYLYDNRKDKKELEELQKEYHQLEQK